MDSREKKSRAAKPQTINSVYMPYEKTVQAVPYYARKKKELIGKNSIYANGEWDNRNSRSSLANSRELRPQNKFTNLITGVTIEPIVDDSKFTSFNLELYPLQKDDYVQVVQKKQFPLQNYYEFTWATKSSEQIYRIAKQTQMKAKEALLNCGGQNIDVLNNKSRKIQAGINGNSVKKASDSRFNPFANVKVQQNGSQRAQKQLAPIHVQYKENNRNNSPFSIKQAQRLSILQSQSKPQQKYRY